MDPREPRGTGWQTYSGLVLSFGGPFAAISGLTAVYRSTFFSSDAVFLFSDLNTWGWIIFSLGALSIISGLAVFSGREWARWTGIAIAGLGALGQLLFAQAYPLWSLMIMGVYLLAVTVSPCTAFVTARPALAAAIATGAAEGRRRAPPATPASPT